MTVFVDQQLPSEIEAGAKAKPRYSTDVITTDGGWEVRNSRWAYPLFQFEIAAFEPGRTRTTSMTCSTSSSISSTSAAARLGRSVPLLARQAGGRPADRSRGRLDDRPSSCSGPTREAASAATARSPGRYWFGHRICRWDRTSAGVDYDTGQIVFTEPPGAFNAVVKADFEHDVPVRFADDELEMVGLTDDLDQTVNVTLMELPRVRDAPASIHDAGHDPADARAVRQACAPRRDRAGLHGPRPGSRRPAR
jgi:hypothetical protein